MNTSRKNSLYDLAIAFFVALIFTLFLEFFIRKMDLLALSTLFKNPWFYYELVFGILFNYLLFKIFTKKVSAVILCVIYAILIIGNLIKINFHNSILLPTDFLLIDEMIAISKSYIDMQMVVILAIFAVIIILIALLIAINVGMKRKKLTFSRKEKKKSEFGLINIVYSLILLVFIISQVFLLNKAIPLFSDISYTGYDRCIKFGYGTEFIYEISKLSNLSMDTTAQYSEIVMNDLKKK